METLLFIRHAETDLAGRFCGRSDPPVNERGRLQIEELRRALESEKVDAVYTSDLSRALTTADAVAKVFGLSAISVPGLREISFGEWEGLSWREIESRDPAYAERWSKDYPNLPAPGGEQFEDFEARVLTEVERLLAISHYRSAAVVTHGGVMRAVLRSLCGADETEAWERTREYCSFFRYEPGGRL